MSTYFYVRFICYSILHVFFWPLPGWNLYTLCAHSPAESNGITAAPEKENKTDIKHTRVSIFFPACDIMYRRFLFFLLRFFLHPNYTIELMHVYATLLCVCIWAQDIEIQNIPPTNERMTKRRMETTRLRTSADEEQQRKKKAKTEKKTWPLTSIDSNSQAHTWFDMCISWL